MTAILRRARIISDRRGQDWVLTLILLCSWIATLCLLISLIVLVSVQLHTVQSQLYNEQQQNYQAKTVLCSVANHLNVSTPGISQLCQK
jgi:hypothetical protein